MSRLAVTALVVAKAPVPGLAKTRLAASIGDDRAADVAAAALLDTLDAVASAGFAKQVVAFTGDLVLAARSDEISSRLQDFTVIGQRGDDFGQRLANAHADTAAVYGTQGLDRDVNRDGNPEGSSRLFAVLWDEASGDVWVDTDQDHSFTDELTLGEFNERGAFGVFGTDDPETPVRESIGFGVQIDADRKLLALNLGVASHASLVVGAAVASRGEAGRFEGMAPGAQLERAVIWDGERVGANVSGRDGVFAGGRFHACRDPRSGSATR